MQVEFCSVGHSKGDISCPELNYLNVQAPGTKLRSSALKYLNVIHDVCVCFNIIYVYIKLFLF